MRQARLITPITLAAVSWLGTRGLLGSIGDGTDPGRAASGPLHSDCHAHATANNPRPVHHHDPVDDHKYDAIIDRNHEPVVRHNDHALIDHNRVIVAPISTSTPSTTSPSAAAPATPCSYDGRGPLQTNTITLRQGTWTLTEIRAACPTAPLTEVDPVRRVWVCHVNLTVINGASLKLAGAAVGGDVNTLRIQSRPDYLPQGRQRHNRRIRHDRCELSPLSLPGTPPFCPSGA